MIRSCDDADGRREGAKRPVAEGDAASMRTVAEGIDAFKGPETGVLIITHYQRILNYVKPTNVSVLLDGRVVKRGGPELAHELEAKGYDWLRAAAP